MGRRQGWSNYVSRWPNLNKAYIFYIVTIIYCMNLIPKAICGPLGSTSSCLQRTYNADISSDSLQQPFAISSVPSENACILRCVVEKLCLSLVYVVEADNEQSTCKLYNERITEVSLVTAPQQQASLSSSVYIEKARKCTANSNSILVMQKDDNADITEEEITISETNSETGSETDSGTKNEIVNLDNDYGSNTATAPENQAAPMIANDAAVLPTDSNDASPSQQGGARWGPWSPWTVCTSCGAPTTRSRTCASYQGCTGYGDPMESSMCQTGATTSTWANWEAWSPCTQTCTKGYGNVGVSAGGKQTRTRQCNKSYGGCGCEGESTQTGECAKNACGDWTPWINATCPKQCGGTGTTMKNTRTCTAGGQVGGQPMTDCVGSAESSVTCQPIPDGTWGNWESWTTCSVSCTKGYGGTGVAPAGTKTRTRMCNKSSGCPCPAGNDKEQEPCGANACPEWTTWNPQPCVKQCGTPTSSKKTRTCMAGDQPAPGKCVGSAEEPIACEALPAATWSNWGDWSPCSQTCSKGYGSAAGKQTRSMQCQVPSYGGCKCTGSSPVDQQECGKNPCPEWTDWIEKTPCPTQCGATGSGMRVRSCMAGNSPAPQGSCPGNAQEPISCNPPPLATWALWSEWSPCGQTCMSGYGGKPGAQTASRSCNNKSPGCDCTGDASRSQQCGTNPCPTPPPTYGEWSVWGPCSVTCGTGEQLRTRQCSGSGQCVGDATSKQVCQQNPCATGYYNPQFQKFYESRAGGGATDAGR